MGSKTLFKDCDTGIYYHQHHDIIKPWGVCYNKNLSKYFGSFKIRKNKSYNIHSMEDDLTEYEWSHIMSYVLDQKRSMCNIIIDTHGTNTKDIVILISNNEKIVLTIEFGRKGATVSKKIVKESFFSKIKYLFKYYG